jgi:hypothetical protein
MATAVLAARLNVIRETSEKLRESINDGFLQDALRHALQLNHLTSQMASEWCANTRETHLRTVVAVCAAVEPSHGD